MTPKEAQAKLDKIRALVNTDDDGPEGSMGPRWILGQVREILGGTDAPSRSSLMFIGQSNLVSLYATERERRERAERLFGSQATDEAEKLVSELTAAAPADRVLHCWTDEREHAEEVHGRLSPQWAEVWFRDVSGTCMLPQGHDGPHQFTPDDQIGVTFAPDSADEAEKLVAELMAAARQPPTTSRRLQPANPHPSGCHTEAPGARDCDSDGHESCDSCSRRKEPGQAP